MNLKIQLPQHQNKIIKKPELSQKPKKYLGIIKTTKLAIFGRCISPLKLDHLALKEKVNKSIKAEISWSTRNTKTLLSRGSTVAAFIRLSFETITKFFYERIPKFHHYYWQCCQLIKVLKLVMGACTLCHSLRSKNQEINAYTYDFRLNRVAYWQEFSSVQMSILLFVLSIIAKNVSSRANTYLKITFESSCMKVCKRKNRVVIFFN